MQKEKVLSIIIPHYESKELLQILIDSIPYKEEIEVLVVDDNSKEFIDNLVLKEWGRQIQIYKNNSKSRGAGLCRNIGLEQATGKWLLFADADDYFVDGWYEKVSSYFESEYDIIYFTPTSVDLETKKFSNRHNMCASLVATYLQEKNTENSLNLRYKSEPPWSKLIRRSVVEENKIKFDSTAVANDIMFSTKVAYYAQKITATKEVIYCITKSNFSLTSDGSKEKFYIRLGVNIRKLEFLKQNVDKSQRKIMKIYGNFLVKRAKRAGFTKKEVRKIFINIWKVGGISYRELLRDFIKRT